MDKDIARYTVGFVTARLSVVMLTGYAIYWVLRAHCVPACSANIPQRSRVSSGPYV